MATDPREGQGRSKLPGDRIGDIKRLRLESGDILVLFCPDTLRDRAVVQRLKESLERELRALGIDQPPPILVLDSGLRLGVLAAKGEGDAKGG